MVVTEAEDSFQTRVKAAVNGKYLPCMRRSMQSLALYEANRCLTTRYGQLRPFQRKYAFSATVVDLLGTLDFLNNYHRQEIMFRTNASKDPLQPDLAWRRMKLISRDINQTILPKAKELIEKEWNSDKSHDEICEMLLQSMYEDSTENTKPHPPMWEFNHNNAFTVYRVYYRGISPDPNIFAPIPPRLVDVPSTKPAGGWVVRGDPNIASSINGNTLVPLANMTISPGRGRKNNASRSDEERRAMLKEVKDHTELLKEFEGVIPEEELAERKRALYAALPPVPSPASVGGGGGGRRQNKKKVKVEAPIAMEEEEDEWEKVDDEDNHVEAIIDLAEV